MPATATAPRVRVAEYFLPGLNRSIAYAEMLVKDIPAAKFGHMPHPNMNHPAFNIGHLSLYPNRMFMLLDRKDQIVEKAGFPELFQAGVQCVEQDGRYPSKDEIVNYFMQQHRKVAELLPNIADSVFERPNPIEGRMREIFPTVGAAVSFLTGAHPMSHLGQISAWRRAIGLGPVM